MARYETADVHRFAEDHRTVGEQVQQASEPDPEITAAMGTAYGSAGAAFTNAITAFIAARQTSGSELAGQYGAFATAVRTRIDGLNAIDATNAQDVAAI